MYPHPHPTPNLFLWLFAEALAFKGEGPLQLSVPGCPQFTCIMVETFLVSFFLFVPFSCSLSLGDDLIQSEILIQKAINP